MSHRFRVDVACGQNTESQQVRQVARIRFIGGVFNSVVLLDGQCIGQMHRIAMLDQAIDEPVPVIGGLNNDATNRILIGLQVLLNSFEVVIQSFFTDQLIVVVYQRNHAVVAVKVNSAVELH